MGQWGAVCGLLAAVMALVGCASGPKFSEIPGVTTAASNDAGLAGAMTNGGTELIHVGDALDVVFNDLPQGKQEMIEQVKADGTITLLLNKTFQAVGKTRGQLAKEIRAGYVPDYYVNMTVTIMPQDRFFFVGGEVRSPSRQAYVGPMTVLKAIQSCGDFTDFANKRKVTVTHVNGKTERVDCIAALNRPELDLEVLPGDKIHVPRRLFW